MSSVTVIVFAPKRVKVGVKTKMVRAIQVRLGTEILVDSQVECEPDTPDRCYVIDGTITAVV